MTTIPVPTFCSQALSCIDDFFFRGNVPIDEKKALWHVLTALRGPDDPDTATAKHNTTNVIRRHAFPILAGDMPMVLGSDVQTGAEGTSGPHWRLNTFSGSWQDAYPYVNAPHFVSHVFNAFRVLGLHWNQPNPLPKLSVAPRDIQSLPEPLTCRDALNYLDIFFSSAALFRVPIDIDSPGDRAVGRYATYLGERRALWDILSALRGPDLPNPSTLTLKHYTTEVIRRHAFPISGRLLTDYVGCDIQTGDEHPRAVAFRATLLEDLVAPNSNLPHFVHHARWAFMALGLHWNQPNPLPRRPAS